MSRSNPASRPWKSLLSFVFALGLGLLAAPAAQACLIDTDTGNEDCSFSLRKTEARLSPKPNNDRWNAEGELNTLPSETMPDDIDADGVGVSYGYLDSSTGAFVEIDRVDFTGEECVARGGNYRRVRCKTDGGLVVLAPRSALSFFKVIARMNKRTLLPLERGLLGGIEAENYPPTPVGIVLHSPEGANRGDSIGNEAGECRYISAREKKLVCKRLP